MKMGHIIASIMGACAGASALAGDEIVIKEYDGNGAFIRTQSVFNSPPADKPVALHQDTRHVDILPEDAGTDVPFLTFSGGPGSNESVRFYLGYDYTPGGYDFVNSDEEPLPMGRHFKGMDARNNLAATTYLYGGITGAFGTDDEDAPDYYDWNNGGGAKILVDRLVRFDADGTIRGDFTVDRPGGPNADVFVIEGGDLSDKCDIGVNHGPIVRVRGVGDMKAKIVLENGDILLIDAGSRITGYGPQPIWVKKGRIKKILAGQEISQFTSSGLDQAMIRANEGIEFIKCTSANSNHGFIDAYIVANYYDGSDPVTDGSIQHIETSNLVSGLRSNARIVASKLMRTSVDNDGLVKITGSLNGELVIGNSGLTGQVITNAANGSGTWSDKVFVGSVELSSTSHGAPYYDVASSSLGGGAIGLVPYNLYGVDCQPASGSTILDSAFNQKLVGGYAQYNTSIKLRFYGPVSQNDTDPAIKVEQLLGSEWINLTDRAVVTFGSATGGNPREVTIRGTDGSTNLIPFLSGTYRITRVAGELKCQETSASPAPDVAAFTYAFTLTDDCNKNNRFDSVDLAESAGDPPVYVFDFNNNSIVDSCDRPTGGWCLADIDNNGFINGNDYDWFSEFYENAHFLADVNEDGFVNGDDYDLFSEMYETACQ